VVHFSPVCDSDDCCGCGPVVGEFCGCEECHEAAVACSDERDPGRVYVVSCLEILGGFFDVLEVCASAVVYVEVLELDAVAGAAADVRREERVARDEEGLDGRVPGVRYLPCRSSVYPEDAGTAAFHLCGS